MKRALLLLADGFEEIEALTVVDILKRGNVQCNTASIKNIKKVLGAHNILVESDNILDEIDIDEYDAVVLPGGMPGATNLRDNKKVIKALEKLNKDGKIISAICAAPIVLEKAGVLKGKKATAYPGFEDDMKSCDFAEDIVCQDENIITSRGPATAQHFAFKILENLVEDKKVVQKVKEDMLVGMI